jgi:hypothetical protein
MVKEKSQKRLTFSWKLPKKKNKTCFLKTLVLRDWIIQYTPNFGGSDADLYVPPQPIIASSKDDTAFGHGDFPGH